MIEKINKYIDIFQKQCVSLEIINHISGGFSVTHKDETIDIGFGEKYNKIHYTCKFNGEEIDVIEDENEEGRMLPVLYRAIVMVYTKTQIGFIHHLKKLLPVSADEIKFKLNEFDCIKDGFIDWISMNSLFDYYSVEFKQNKKLLLKDLPYLNEN